MLIILQLLFVTYISLEGIKQNISYIYNSGKGNNSIMNIHDSQSF